MVEVVRTTITGPIGNLQADVVPVSFDPTKSGLVVTNPDGTDIFTERQGNLGIDTLDSTYFYFGSTQVGTTNRRIKRMKKSDLSIDWTTGITDPATAWTDRISLTYSISL